MSVTLGGNGLVLVLPNPDFENSEALEFDRIQRSSRGGDLTVFRDPAWPQTDTLKYRFTYLSQALVNSLLNFIQQNLGTNISMTDFEGRGWVGFITNPTGNISQPGRYNFAAGFDFQGTLDF